MLLSYGQFWRMVVTASRSLRWDVIRFQSWKCEHFVRANGTAMLATRTGTPPQFFCGICCCSDRNATSQPQVITPSWFVPYRVIPEASERKILHLCMRGGACIKEQLRRDEQVQGGLTASMAEVVRCVDLKRPPRRPPLLVDSSAA